MEDIIDALVLIAITAEKLAQQLYKYENKKKGE